MTAPLPLMTEDEVRRIVVDGESGFGALSTERGRLPLREMSIEARVVATFAHTTLRQVFVNNLGTALEATYIFPLPDRAAVTRFVLEVAGRRVEGKLEERGAARAEYERATAAGQRAAIAEEERPGVFTMRVGNVMPGESATVTLELTGPLPVLDGEATYRFPLVVAQRYMPGQLLGGDDVGDGTAHDTDAVPDASRISPPVLLPGHPNPVRLHIAVELDPAGLPLSRVRSSLHAAYADAQVGSKAGRLVVRTTPGERLDRDFVLRFCLADGAMHTTARLLRGDGEHTFAVSLVPSVTTSMPRPKDVVFVIDRSGSMRGWKMVAARRATSRMIDALRATDRFQVLAFDNIVEPLPFSAQLVDATDRDRFRATEWLAKVDARGGTEMAEPLSRASDLLAGDDLARDRVLVFVTDGQAGNEAQVLSVLGQRLRGARVFALGIDTAVNGAFMNRLAGLGRSGEAELVESEDRLDEVLVRLHRRVDTPLIAELTVDVEGAELLRHTLAPAQLPDVFAGVPATILGRVRGNGAPTLIVRGKRSDGTRFEERIVVDETRNTSLASAWARHHVRDLEDRLDSGQGDRDALARQITEVALKHSVLCRFTAFVAVDDEVVNRGGKQQHVVQAVESAGGGGYDALAMSAPAPMSAPMPAPMASMGPPMPGAPGAPPKPTMRGRRMSFSLSEGAAAPKKMKAAAPERERAAKAEAASHEVFGATADSARKQAPVDVLGQVKPQLTELVQLLRKGGDARTLATEVARRLALLVEELAHLQASPELRAPFEDALQRLRAALAGTASLEDALRDVEQRLDTAAGGVPKSRGLAFWK